MVDQWGRSWQYSAHKGCILNGDPSSQEPWRAVDGDDDLVMLSLGTTALEILSSLNCNQPMDDFQSYPHL